VADYRWCVQPLPTGIALYARPWPEMSGQASGILATTALPLAQIEQTFVAKRKPRPMTGAFLQQSWENANIYPFLKSSGDSRLN
jgi:hypothetical protein